MNRVFRPEGTVRRFVSPACGFFLILAGLLCFSCRREGGLPDFNAVRIREGVVHVEKAVTERQKATGLMFRTSLETNRGMIFFFNPPSTPSFYMKNTALPLDILFISPELKVVTIRRMEPFDAETFHAPSGLSAFALEVNAGWAVRHGIREGDSVKFLNLIAPAR